jgi:hypothetical protein
MVIHFFRRLAERTCFPEVTDITTEQKRLGIVRILLGIILFVRTAEIAYSSWFYFPTHTLSLIAVCELILVTAFLLGIALPLTTPILLFSITLIDYMHATGTLGTSITVQLLLVMFFCRHGQFYSIDAWLMKKKNASLGKIVLWLYNRMGQAEAETIRISYFLGFLSYAIVSFGALAYHLNDDYWLRFLTVKGLLLNSFLCKHYDFFRWLESACAFDLLYWLSIFAVIFQSIFQFGMIPLLFWKKGTRFVILWGWIFFLISFFFIQLSYLPHVELCFWYLLFHRATVRSFSQASLPLLQVRPLIARLQSGFYALVFFIYILISFPFIGAASRAVFDTIGIGSTHKTIARQLPLFGFDMPNVFNKTDLEMGDKWAVLYRILPDSSREMVPLVGMDGQRIPYYGSDYFQLKNMNSDVFYFGNVLRYRRALIDRETKAFHQSENGYGYLLIKNLAAFDRRYTKKTDIYLFEVYGSQSSNLDLPATERYKKIVLHTDYIRF